MTNAVVRKSQSCKMDELAALVHPRDGHRKIFAMIEAYLDESGIHDGAVVCVIAGYFGGRGQWKKFEALWRKTLADFNVPLDKFHAKEFVRRRDFFSGWKDTVYNDFTEAVSGYLPNLIVIILSPCLTGKLAGLPKLNLG